MDEFLEFTAGVFGCDVSELSGDTTYKEFELWDSLMMLRLLSEIEEKYKVVIPYFETDGIETLSDIYTEYIEA